MLPGIECVYKRLGDKVWRENYGQPHANCRPIKMGTAHNTFRNLNLKDQKLVRKRWKTAALKLERKTAGPRIQESLKMKWVYSMHTAPGELLQRYTKYQSINHFFIGIMMGTWAIYTLKKTVWNAMNVKSSYIYMWHVLTLSKQK